MNKQQRGLGKGLSALLGDAGDLDQLRSPVGYVNKAVVGTREPQDTADILRIPVDMIEPNPFQPRMSFDQDALQELAVSIRTFGLIQPITVNSLTAADSVIIPVQPEFFALEGLGKLLQTVRLVQNGVNPSLTIEGFVVTMFDGRTKVHTQVLNQLREHFKDMVFNTIIQRNIRLSEAPSHGKPIILYDVMSNGTSNYLNLAKEVLEKNAN